MSTLRIEVTPEFERRLQSEAARRGQSIEDAACAILHEGVPQCGSGSGQDMGSMGGRDQRPAGGRVSIDEHGLPVIRCGPDPAAAHMSREELLELEQ